MEVEVEIDHDIYLPCYQHLLLGEQIDLEFLWGGRDGGKSRHTAMQLVEECLDSGYFQCLLIRKVLNTVRDSQYSLLKSVIQDWGLSNLFRFNDTRLEIHCKNGNSFYGRGLDDVGRIKSFNNPSHCWIEEGNQITNEDFVIILTSLRANGVDVRTFFTFNPECDGNYIDFWLWQEWFQHTQDLSWTWTKAVETTEEIFKKFPNIVYERDGKYYIDQHARSTHTTYNDNPYCSPLRIAMYESYKGSKVNSYWYQTYTLGLWGYRKTGGAFWKAFDEEKHIEDLYIQEDNTYHLVVDNNVSPYISLAFWQIDSLNKTLRQVDELPCPHPLNSAQKSANAAGKWLHNKEYKLPVYLYGDPSANAKSTNDSDGLSFFDKFKAELIAMGFVVVDRVQRSAPRVAMSGAFINEIFESKYAGWSILVDTKCRTSIEDYLMTKEAADGTILKKRIIDKDTGISYEKYGHFSDNLRYFVTTVLDDEYETYQNRDNYGISRVN